MAQTPTPDLTSQIAAAAPTVVSDALLRASQHFRSGEWLPIANRYRLNTVKAFRDDVDSSSVVTPDIEEYVAVSALHHCLDGWTFFGQALQSRIGGNPHTARHLGYYAELRAAMSLLACEGIGVFHNRHYIVQATGGVNAVKNAGGTHEFAARALGVWADTPRAEQILMQLIKPDGIAIGDWLRRLEGIVGTPPSRPLARQWLKTWGFDLTRLAEDHTGRNESSYRPMRLANLPSANSLEVAKLVSSFWHQFAPSGQSTFQRLDRHLLRVSLDQHFRALHDVSGDEDDTNSDVDFPILERVIPQLLEELGFSGPFKTELNEFLSGVAEPGSPEVLELAERIESIDHPQHHLHVLSRAAMLLRIASGSCQLLIRNSGISTTDLSFWWERIGEERGFWEPGEPPDSLADLWADMMLPLEEVDHWIASGTSTHSCAALHRSHSHNLSILMGCERVALWGMLH